MGAPPPETRQGASNAIAKPAPSHARRRSRRPSINTSFTSQPENRNAGGMGPPASKLEPKMMTHLLLLLLIMVILGRKVKITIETR